MRNFFLHIVGILQLMFFISCNDSDITLVDAGKEEGYVWVTLRTTIPVLELPSGRAITDDGAINNYSVWVFSEDKFVEAINDTDTYQEDGVTKSKVRLQDDGNMYILLPENLKNVTLAMVTNVDLNGKQPEKGVLVSAANATFEYLNSTGMPMYGVNDKKFDVALGADGGTIVLRRAMAKVEVHIADNESAVLEEIYVYNANATGMVKELGSITNSDSFISIQGNIDGNNSKKGHVYLPEINLENQNADNKSFVIVKINGKYYKLDFVARSMNGATVSYAELKNIIRNYRYIFELKKLSIVTGYTTLEEAKASTAGNSIPTGEIKLTEITEEYIKDITTDNYIYIGLTTSDLKTSPLESYHVANVDVVTNHVGGWRFETPLPEGVEVSMTSDKPVNDISSVWIFLDNKKYKSGDIVNLYILVGTIRKSIIITVP